MKKGAIAILGICLMVFLCAGPAPAKPIVLKMACHLAETHSAVVNGLVPYLKQIEEVTNGRVKIEKYWGQSLCKNAETMAATTRGAADIGYIGAGFTAGIYNLAEVAALPFLSFPTTKAINGAMWSLQEKFPEIQQEHKKQNLHPLLYYNVGYYFPMTSEKAGPIRTLEDWKGKKLRTLAGPQTDAIKALGAVPVMVPYSDLYVAVERGTVDGINLTYTVIISGGFGEVLKYFTLVPISWGFTFVAMNLDTWNSLPKDIQDAITSISGKKGSELIGANVYDVTKAPALAELKRLEKEGGYKHELIYPPEKEIARWVEVAGKPVWNKWIDRCVKAGGYSRARTQEVLDEFLNLAKEYK